MGLTKDESNREKTVLLVHSNLYLPSYEWDRRSIWEATAQGCSIKGRQGEVTCTKEAGRYGRQKQGCSE